MANKVISTAIFILLSVLLCFSVSAKTCDEADLFKCQDDLRLSQQNYALLVEQYSALNTSYYELRAQLLDLNQTLMEVQSERDYYKSLYENAPLSNLTVKDFLNLTNQINQYNFIFDNRIFNMNRTMQQFIDNQSTFNENVRFKLNLSLTIEIALLSLSLIGISIYLFKKFFYSSSKTTENTSISVTHHPNYEKDTKNNNK